MEGGARMDGNAVSDSKKPEEMQTGYSWIKI